MTSIPREKLKELALKAWHLLRCFWKPFEHYAFYTPTIDRGGWKLLGRRFEFEEQRCVHCGAIRVRHVYRGYEGTDRPSFGFWYPFNRMFSGGYAGPIDDEFRYAPGKIPPTIAVD